MLDPNHPVGEFLPVMDENWTMIAMALRLMPRPEYIEAFQKIDSAYRAAKAFKPDP